MVSTSLDAWVNATNQHATQLGYDAANPTGRRRQSSTNLRTEDNELLSNRRRQLIAQSRDLMRNIAVARWAIGKHNDFVSRLRFASQTRTDFDYELEARMRDWCENPNLCDIRKQHTFARILRMAESRAVLDGDHLLIRCKGQKLQQIESDRIRTAKLNGSTKDPVVHGCRQDKYGATVAYQVHSRGPNGYGYQYQSEVPAADCMFHGYFPSERADQTRGVGLVTAGLDNFLDAYEWTDDAKAVEKARALIAMIFKTTSADGPGQTAPNGGAGYNVNLGRGPLQLNLNPGDEAEFLSSATPAPATVDFFNQCIGLGLKALDLPMCFFAEGLTNFFGQRAQFILYIESCKSKRDNLRTNILYPLTRWLVRSWVADGSLILPAGLTGTSLYRLPYAWRPAGIPWWNPLQEITAQLMAIRGGLASYEDTYLEVTGQDWFAMITRLAAEQKHIHDSGVILDKSLVPMMTETLIAQQQQQQEQQSAEDKQMQAEFHSLPKIGDMI